MQEFELRNPDAKSTARIFLRTNPAGDIELVFATGRMVQGRWGGEFMPSGVVNESIIGVIPSRARKDLSEMIHPGWPDYRKYR